MRDVALTGTNAPGTVWIRARESRISLWRWRRQCHNSPPMARNGLKDTGATPVAPRYYSPGLPGESIPSGMELRMTSPSQPYSMDYFAQHPEADYNDLLRIHCRTGHPRLAREYRLVDLARHANCARRTLGRAWRLWAGWSGATAARHPASQAHL